MEDCAAVLLFIHRPRLVFLSIGCAVVSRSRHDISASGLPGWYEKLGSSSSREMADASAMAFCEEGGTLTMYLASGKRKHDRIFWVDPSTGVISWDKKRSKKPNKSEIINAVVSNEAIRQLRVRV